MRKSPSFVGVGFSAACVMADIADGVCAPLRGHSLPVVKTSKAHGVASKPQATRPKVNVSTIDEADILDAIPIRIERFCRSVRLVEMQAYSGWPEITAFRPRANRSNL